MRHLTHILQILGLISLMTVGMVLGGLYSDLLAHTPIPVTMISGSLG